MVCGWGDELTPVNRSSAKLFIGRARSRMKFVTSMSDSGGIRSNCWFSAFIEIGIVRF